MGGSKSSCSGLKSHLPEGVPKPPFAKGVKGVGDLQPDRMFGFELFKGDAFDERVLGIEQRSDHIVVRIAEAGFVETEAGGKAAEDFSVGQGFAGRGQRRARQLQVEVTVGVVEVGVFEEGGCGQNDVGKIGRCRSGNVRGRR